MGGLEDVLARMINEREFREELTADPTAALAGYDLSREDLEILAASLDEQADGEHAVEQRTSKSTLLGMLGALAVDDDAASGLPTGKRRHHPFTVLTPADQGASDDLFEDELGSFAGAIKEPSAPPEASDASSLQQTTGDGSADAARQWNLEQAWVKKTTGPRPGTTSEEGQILFGDGEHGATPDTTDNADGQTPYTYDAHGNRLSTSPAATGEDGEYVIAEAADDGTAADPHKGQIEILSFRHQVADDDGAARGDTVEVMDFQTDTDVPSQDSTPAAGSDGDPDAPIVVGSLPNDADPVQYEETDLDFVHERGELEGQQRDPLAGEPRTEADGDGLAESLDVLPEGENTGRAVEGDFAPETGTDDMPAEDVTLNFDEIKVEYEPQDGGNLDAPTEGAYDIEQNEPSSDEDGA